MFPDAFPGPLGVSLIGTALRERGLWRLETVDIRGFSKDKAAPGRHPRWGRSRAGDGGRDRLGAGQRRASWSSAFVHERPGARPLTQAMVREWSSGPGLIVLCGRFEGVDQRLIDGRVFEEVSVGDAALAGGRGGGPGGDRGYAYGCCPACWARPESLREESPRTGLEQLHLTRPRTFEGRDIPEVLPFGHHGAVAKGRARAEREPSNAGSGVRTSGRPISPNNRQRARQARRR